MSTSLIPRLSGAWVAGWLGVYQINVDTYLFYATAGSRLLSFDAFVLDISLGLPSVT